MAKSNALSIPTVLSSNIGVDKDDLIAIKVAAVETELINRQAQTEQDLRELKKELKQHHEKAEALAESTAEAAFDAQTAVDALKAIGIVVKASICSKFDMDKCTLKAELVLRSGEGYHGNSMSSSKELKPPATLKKLCDKIQETMVEIDEVQTRMIDIRKRLSQIGTLERQAKAAMAQNILQGSKEGRALLATLNEVEGLPEVK